jgi:hypothetical protein
MLCICAVAGAGQGDDWKVYGTNGEKDFNAFFYLVNERRLP